MAMSKSHCDKKVSKHTTHTQMDKSSSSHASVENDKCTCKTDCKHSNCTSNCSDYSHCVLGLINRIDQSPINPSLQVSIFSQTLYQKLFMVQYRPPKSLQS